MVKKKTHQRLKKKKDLKIDYISIILALVLIVSMSYVIFKATNPDFDINGSKIMSLTYNEFDFQKDSGIWYTQIEKNNQPYIIMTEFNPLEVENISMIYNPNYFKSLTKPKSNVYISFDPREINKSDVTVASVDLVKGLSTVFNTKIRSGCFVNDTGCKEIIRCNSTDDAVIEIIRDDNPRAVYDKNCLKIYGKNKELIKVINRILFEWYDIIKINQTTHLPYRLG